MRQAWPPCFRITHAVYLAILPPTIYPHAGTHFAFFVGHILWAFMGLGHSRLPLNPRLLVGLVEHGLGYILGPDFSLFRDSVLLLGLRVLHISIGGCGRSACKI